MREAIDDEAPLDAPSDDSFLQHIDETELEHALKPVRTSNRPALWPLMERRIKARENTDLQVHIGDELIHCHLLPLQCFSEYFERQVTPGQAVVELPEQEIRPAAFRIVYEWILDSNQPLEWQHFVAVLSAAEFLQVPALIERCWLHLDNPRVVENVAFYVYMQAQQFATSNELQTMMLRRICRYFLALVSTPEFCELSLADLGVLLSSNIIAIFDETDVLYAACQWLLYDWLDRKELIEDVMCLVRFKSMHTGDLARLCVFHECTELQPILRHPATKQLVDEALAYICSPRNIAGSSERATTGDGRKRSSAERVRLVPDSLETLAYVTGEGSFNEFKIFLHVMQKKPTIWRTFRVSEENAGLLDDMVGCTEAN
ncbi:AGAP009292-PA-like protein [Anopheles sinensis]|uniref:AGAP009292-PA-like protein n=1 Tax=Anopheles sinensis TaxID=74873 RepID=A0A084W6N1_ANOSI|nr:AGAP009292-PA-like protein [Anopheles sinensis]